MSKITKGHSISKRWKPAHPGSFKRSFDYGKTWHLCGRRDVLNAFGKLKAIKVRLEAGEEVFSEHGVLYKKA